MTDVETIREIERLTIASQGILPVPNSKQGAYYLRQPDGPLELVVPELAPYRTEALDTESLVALAVSSHSVTILVGERKVTAVAEAGGHRTLHTLDLPVHPVSFFLEQHLNTKTYGQRELVRLLRSKLAGFVHPTVVETFRALKLSATSDGESVLGKGSEALSRSITARVETKGGTSIPETITVTGPVFDLPDTRDHRYDVTLLVDAQPDKDGAPTFELTTVHNELQAARDEAYETLVQHLRDLAPNTPVYRANLG
jgi:hypothetical protein